MQTPARFLLLCALVPLLLVACTEKQHNQTIYEDEITAPVSVNNTTPEPALVQPEQTPEIPAQPVEHEPEPSIVEQPVTATEEPVSQPVAPQPKEEPKPQYAVGDLSTPESAVYTLEWRFAKQHDFDFYLAKTYYSPTFSSWLAEHDITVDEFKEYSKNSWEWPGSSVAPTSRVGEIRVTGSTPAADGEYNVSYTVEQDYSGLDYSFGDIHSYSYMRKVGDEWLMDIEPEYRDAGVMDSAHDAGLDRVPTDGTNCGEETQLGFNWDGQSPPIGTPNVEARECFKQAYDACAPATFTENTVHFSIEKDVVTYWWSPGAENCTLNSRQVSFSLKHGESVYIDQCDKFTVYPWSYEGKTPEHWRWYGTGCKHEGLFPNEFVIDN